MHVRNTKTQEVEAKGVQDQFGLQTKFQNSQEYITTLCPKKKKNINVEFTLPFQNHSGYEAVPVN